jgi:hypothetical protein
LPDGAWLGFRRSRDGYELAVGTGAEVRTVEADADELVTAAVAYFEEALDDPPTELAATHEDMAELVRWLVDHAGSGRRRRLLQEAMDAIDDGLPGEVVATRLEGGRETPDEHADAVDLLVRRVIGLIGSTR